MSASQPNTILIDDPGDPRVAGYMNLKDAWLRFQAGEPDNTGRFIAEGELVIRQLVASDYEVESVLGTRGGLGAIVGVLGDLPDGTPVYEASREVLEGIAGFDVHRGLLALGVRGSGRILEDVLRHARAVVVLEDLSNHDNLGGIVRSVAALCGTDVPVLLSPRACDPLYRKAIRVSMGQVLRVPWARIEGWPGSIGRLEELGFEPIALTPAGDAEPIGDVVGGGREGRRLALILGAEGPGLGAKTLGRARRVRIPIDSRADSLNVGVAASIAMFVLLGGSGLE